jgi:hypothetical protein
MGREKVDGATEMLKGSFNERYSAWKRFSGWKLDLLENFNK